MWLLSLHRSGANSEFRSSQVWDLAPAVGEGVRVEDPDRGQTHQYLLSTLIIMKKKWIHLTINFDGQISTLVPPGGGVRVEG